MRRYDEETAKRASERAAVDAEAPADGSERARVIECAYQLGLALGAIGVGGVALVFDQKSMNLIEDRWHDLLKMQAGPPRRLETIGGLRVRSIVAFHDGQVKDV